MQMKPATIVLIGLLMLVNVFVFFGVVGLRPRISDRPIMIAKSATAETWQESMVEIAFSYSRVFGREQHLMMAGAFSCVSSAVVLLILVVNAVSKKDEVTQSHE